MIPSMRRLLAAATAAALALLAVSASTAHARCAPMPLPREIARATFIVEATVARLDDDGTAVFRVDARYKGTPPATVTIRQSGRGRLIGATDVGARYVVFFMTNDDGQAYVYRCGSSRRLEGAEGLLEELRRRGLRRQPI